jgi:putative transferase (TIGR04331 family)
MRKKLIFKLRNLNLKGKKNRIILNHPNSYLIKKDSNNEFFLSNSEQNSRSLIKDFNYINKIYEKNLTYLAKFLNEFHDVNYPKLYWRILIGVWLYKFISIVFERWNSLKKITTKYKKIDIENLEYKSKNFIPYGAEDFAYFIENDDWNNYIYLEIINIFKFDSIKKEKNIKKLYFKNSKIIYSRLTFKNNNFINKIFNCFQYFLLKINRNLKYFIFDTSQSNLDEIILNFKLNKKLLLFKSLKSENLYPNFISVKEKMSEKRKTHKTIDKNNFNQVLYNLCKKNIPKFYLEHFKLTNRILEKFILPKKPKVIFSAKGFAGGRNTLMDMYTGKCAINGTKLIIAQHGGNYGQHKIHPATIHETTISKRFLSWGFKSGKKIKSLGIIKKNVKEIKHNNNNDLIILEARTRNLYSHTLRINYGAVDSSSYLKNLCDFFSNLNDKQVINQLRVKMHATNFGLKDKEFFLKSNRKIRFLNSELNTRSFYNKAKLVIHTFPGTGHLEAMASNIPNLVFFLNDMNLLNNKTKKYFLEFKRLGIMHDNPNSLVHHLNKISKDPAKWWFSKKIQSIRKKYVNDFAKVNQNLINDIIMNIKDV